MVGKETADPFHVRSSRTHVLYVRSFSFLSVPSAVRRSATDTAHLNQVGTVTNRQVDGFRHLASETISVGVFGSVETVAVAYSWQERLSPSVCRDEGVGDSAGYGKTQWVMIDPVITVRTRFAKRAIVWKRKPSFVVAMIRDTGQLL